MHTKEEDCIKCAEDHVRKGYAAGLTPGCLYVSQNGYICTQPVYFKEAANGLCDNKLCPKYSECKAKLMHPNEKGKKYYLLQCLYNPLLLPEPPFIAKVTELMKEIVLESKVMNQQMETLTGIPQKEIFETTVKEKLTESCTNRKAEETKADPQRVKRDAPEIKFDYTHFDVRKFCFFNNTLKLCIFTAYNYFRTIQDA